ncbi:hypothetical protein [Acinetobacter calcoaceticus]|uniref:hypothetical protein n=1 Tax=Acinetobacter calcoaceticus TaxID=471 RepID=UPI00321A686A
MIEQDGYLSTLKEMSPTSGGISAKTYLAEVLWPDGEVIESFVKLFPVNTRIKEIINESFGFLLANSANLRQSSRAALIKLDVSEFSIDTSTDSFAQTNGFVYGWVTSSLGGKDLKKVYLKNPQEIAKDEAQQIISLLDSWPNFKSLVAFDDCIGNIDRNIGNLIFIKKDDIGIIDHGQIFGVIDWQYESIDPTFNCTNCMLNAFKAQYNGTVIHPAVYQPILDVAARNSSFYDKDKVDIHGCITHIDQTIGSNLDKKIDDFFNYFEVRFATIATRLPHALAA